MKPRRLVRLFCESLEDRSVPATLVSPTTMTFQDVDGDIAAVIFSKPVLDEYNVNEVFQFDAGSVNGSNGLKQSLRNINLVARFAVDINGADMTVKVISKARRGDGEVHVGNVFSYGERFGKLDIQGDLGRAEMDRYDGDRKLADSLSVNSTGRFDPQGNTQYLSFAGVIDTFLVRGDLAGAVSVGFDQSAFSSMEVWGSVKGSFRTGDWIDTVLIRGDIDGTAYPNHEQSSNIIGFSSGGVGTFSLTGSVLGSAQGGGQLTIDGTGQNNLGTLTIGGSIVGSDASFSGTVVVLGSYQSITVNGSIRGGEAQFSGALNPGDSKNVVINGSIIGGAGYHSGQLSNFIYWNGVHSDQKVDRVQIKGNVVGGTGEQSGSIHMVNPTSQLIIVGTIRGGNGYTSASVLFDSSIRFAQVQAIIGGAGESSGVMNLNDRDNQVDTNRVLINGSIRGGTGPTSGGIVLLGSSNLQINGSVIGYTGTQSGFVLFAAFQDTEPDDSNLLIRGSVIGNAGDSSGSVISSTPMDQVSILGDMVGAQGFRSGSMQLDSFDLVFHAHSITVGSLHGGIGFRSGSIASSLFEVNTVRVLHSMVGGSGQESGSVIIRKQDVQQVFVTEQVKGGKGYHSGVIEAHSLEILSVGGSVLGGDGEYSGGVLVDKRLGTARIGRDLAGNFGYFYAGHFLGDGFIESVSIGGSIKNSAVISTGAIGAIAVRGSILGTAAAPSYIISHGAYLPAATPGQPYLLRSLTVGGDVTNTTIVMGNSNFDQVEVARVGKVSVSRNWSNNLLVVGYDAGSDGILGTDDDVLINTDAPPSIDSLFIGGNILGNKTSIVQAGLVSQLKLGQNTVNLIPGEFNDDLLLVQLLRIREKA
ncbi:MAG TPA: hypothetical protein PLN21_18415 [Gemmatales bacterium]|nr:hypothetical protein [Gemmatales bacterium]